MLYVIHSPVVFHVSRVVVKTTLFQNTV